MECLRSGLCRVSTDELTSAITCSGRVFSLVGSLAVERDATGAPLQFMPQADYANLKRKALNPHGAGAFCRFRLPGATTAPGVYVVTQDRTPVYVGIAENLARRWGPMGYGSISPVNCYVGGQSTNCKINSRVLAGTLAGQTYEVWFLGVADNRRAIEVETIKALTPAWNGTR